MRRYAFVLGLVLLLGGVGGWAVPYLADDRDYVAVTPQPDPLFRVALVPLRGGQEACMDQAVLDRYSEQARFRVGTFDRGPVPLELTVRSASYRERVHVAPDYGDSEVLRVPVRPPEGELEATICIRNLGERRVALYASDDRTNSRSQVRVDGRAVVPDFGIVFFERRPVGIAERLPVALERASTFRPVVTPAVLWALLVLFAIGMPLAVLVAFVRSLGDDVRPERSRRS
jgi:hypothetical protein